MTSSTGKRSYRACQRCRSRKTRCDLDSIGEPKAPPCFSCYRSGSKCVLASSLRGRAFRQYRGPKAGSKAHQGHDHNIEFQTQPILPPQQPSIGSDGDSPDAPIDDSDEELCAELRNPADALQILARSGEARHDKPLSPPSASISPIHHPVNAHPSGREPQAQSNQLAPNSKLEHYDLVQRGLLGIDLLVDLLEIFSRRYHPYCPIVPSSLLLISGTERLHSADFLLLTIILTIASRDEPEYTTTHHHCWEHTQRLLLDVLLAQPWTQSPQTVRGLLLLAEWLPHVQFNHTSAGEPDSLFAEGRTAWTMIGMAIRHAYLLRLDLAAFRKDNLREEKHGTDQERLIWTHIYIADRQISVRLGQSFWSRGPSLSSNFTAKDFPSLQHLPNTEGVDYANVLHSTLELTQILHNVQDLLYSSRERTLTLVFAGDYSRYLEDFQKAATGWYDTWSPLLVTRRAKNCVMLMYEYLCLYINAFSFQAVLTRLSRTRRAATDKKEPRNEAQNRPFPKGLMASPDCRWIYDAIFAAIKILKMMNELNPNDEMRFLPSRYYLYGIYAAVFLYKAVFSGAYSGDEQKKEVGTLVQGFATALDSVASINFHVCCKYSEMLRKLWARRGPKMTAEEAPDSPSRSMESHPGITHSRSEEPPSSKKQQPSDTQFNEADYLAATDDVSSILLDDQLFGPFLPNVENIGNGTVYDDTGEQLFANMPLVDIGLSGYQEIPWNFDAYLT
ncbi:hypothetical protein HDV64DRAFT_272567 [Trichoderma sp. TUCIM 5745]